MKYQTLVKKEKKSMPGKLLNVKVRQGVKAGIQIDSLLESTKVALESAREDAMAVSLANGTLKTFIEMLAKSLLTQPQQEQVAVILSLWKECRTLPVDQSKH
jgi:hypothetical protein